MRTRKAKIEFELRNLADRVAAGDRFPSLRQGIAERARELREITDQLLGTRPLKSRNRVPEELFTEYKQWAIATGEYEMNERGFSNSTIERWFRKVKIGPRVAKPAGQYYHGLAITDRLPDPATDETDDGIPI
jgi:hypothetical protein